MVFSFPKFYRGFREDPNQVFDQVGKI
ncbi:hypothetical protein SAI_0955, partial [Streptococcus agalactiae H36B]